MIRIDGEGQGEPIGRCYLLTWLAVRFGLCHRIAFWCCSAVKLSCDYLGFCIVGSYVSWRAPIPDIGARESKALVQRKTLDCKFEYKRCDIALHRGSRSTLAALVGRLHQARAVALACVPLEARPHSIMGLADRGRNNDLSQGVYEHVLSGLRVFCSW